jgi:hypothetical protein
VASATAGLSPPPDAVGSSTSSGGSTGAADDDDRYPIGEPEGPMLVREKLHTASPMTLDQALYEMELVGHAFFLFADKDSGLPSVVYRRRAYDYGVIRIDTRTDAATASAETTYSAASRPIAEQNGRG